MDNISNYDYWWCFPVHNNGLILSELDGSGKKFYSSRQNLFSPLESIGIYTDDDSTPLLDVMLEMQAQEASNPPVDEKSDADTLRNYLGTVLPTFDRDRELIIF